MSDKREKALEELCPFDDVLFRCIIKDNYPLAERILRILLRNPKLRVVSLKTQVDMKRLAGSRSLCLDVVTVTQTPAEKPKQPDLREIQDLEVEGSRDRANPYRARYHSSVLDVENLKVGQDFKELPVTWTIFITEEDYFRRGQPFYRVERAVFDGEETTTSQLFQDGAHILYVNGEYADESGKHADFARLMHDFHTADWQQMRIPEMGEAVQRFKKTERGKKKVSKALQELIDEEVADAVAVNTRNVTQSVTQSVTQRIASALLKSGDSPEKVSQATGLSMEETLALEEMIAV